MRTLFIFLLVFGLMAGPALAQTAEPLTDEEAEAIAAGLLGLGFVGMFASWLGLMAFACIPATVAKNKGRSFFIWHMYGFWLWLIALIHAIVLSKENMGKTHARCPHCQEPVRIGANMCPHCRNSLTEAA